MAKVTKKDFVRAWMTSSSAREVAEKTSLSPTMISSYGSRLRRAGVNLPKFPAGAPGCTANVDELNAIVAEFTSIAAGKENR